MVRAGKADIFRSKSLWRAEVELTVSMGITTVCFFFFLRGWGLDHSMYKQVIKKKKKEKKAVPGRATFALQLYS